MIHRSLLVGLLLVAVACGVSEQDVVNDAMRNRGLPEPWEIEEVLEDGACKAIHVVDGGGIEHTVYVREDIVITTVVPGHLPLNPATASCELVGEPFDPSPFD